MAAVDVKAVILIGLLSLGTAGMSLFVQECMKEGMILNWYGKLINYLWDSTKFPKWLLKPLGMCIYCFSSWVWIGLFVVNMLPIQWVRLEFIGLFIGLGFNFIWIKTLEKLH